MSPAKEVCYGIIPLRKVEGRWDVFLVKLRSGDHWGFPKGHGLEGEEGKETAQRELYEETGLTIKQFLSEEQLVETYQIIRKQTVISKTVIYYIAEVSGDIALQFDEICDAKWISLAEAESLITYSELRSVCKKALVLCNKI